MHKLSSDVRRQIVDLGLLSRPLGEARAQQLAASLILSLVQALKEKSDCARVIEHYRQLITEEIRGSDAEAPRPACTRRASWADLLPELH